MLAIPTYTNSGRVYGTRTAALEGGRRPEVGPVTAPTAADAALVWRPWSQEMLAEQTQNMTSEQTQAILCDNVAQLYNIDLATLEVAA